MKTPILCTFMAACLFAGCTPNTQNSDQQSVQSRPTQTSSTKATVKKTIQLGTTTISWNDFTNPLIKKGMNKTLASNEGIYLFTRNTQAAYLMPDGRSVDASQCYTNMLKSADATLRNQYLKCANHHTNQTRNSSSAPSFESFISLAQQAVRADGSCTWLGYDRALDLRARATGQLASASSTHMFFAKLRCGR